VRRKSENPGFQKFVVARRREKFNIRAQPQIIVYIKPQKLAKKCMAYGMAINK